ncbi:MAG: hypothetical protein ACJAWT_002148 [Glaciecola sp.]|jgi:hypothetical protein
MKATLPIKYPLKNCMIKCNLVLMLFLFLSVSLINVAAAGDVSSQSKVIYATDFYCVADSTPEYDSTDGSVGNNYAVTENDALSFLAVQTKTTYSLNYSYLRPITRAPPKVFI